MAGNSERSRGGNRWALLLGVVLVALAISIGYQWWSAKDAGAPPLTRRPFDFVVTWRCLNCGHTVTDNAAVGPRPCTKCGEEACYVSLKWACRRHGVYDVAFQYNDDGKPSRVRFSENDWIPALNEHGGWNLSCPVCDGPLNPAEAPRTRR